jgi:hypothetical protein
VIFPINVSHCFYKEAKGIIKSQLQQDFPSIALQDLNTHTHIVIITMGEKVDSQKSDLLLENSLFIYAEGGTLLYE